MLKEDLGVGKRLRLHLNECIFQDPKLCRRPTGLRPQWSSSGKQGRDEVRYFPLPLTVLLRSEVRGFPQKDDKKANSGEIRTAPGMETLISVAASEGSETPWILTSFSLGYCLDQKNTILVNKRCF